MKIESLYSGNQTPAKLAFANQGEWGTLEQEKPREVVAMAWVLVIGLVAVGTWHVVDWLDNITN